MRIEPQFFSSLHIHMTEKDTLTFCTVEVSDGTTIKQVLEQFGVPIGKVKLIFLNGLHAKDNEVLKDGDRLGVFPPVAGG